MAITEGVGRFSHGQETFDGTPEHTRIGRFSDGQSSLAKHPEHSLVGRFSTGQELLAKSAQARVGQFSDRQGRRSIPVQRQPDTTDRLEMETVTS
jgi:hypothetical protein